MALAWSPRERVPAGSGPPATTHVLDRLPVGAVPQGVTAEPAVHDGRACVRVELTDAITYDGKPGVDYIDQPTFLVIPTDFEVGSISVDVAGRLNHKGPPDARGFAGLAYHLGGEVNQFECVYLRPLNGRRLAPPAPRDRRAVQYFAYPDWPFDRLREAYPDGRFEAPADLRPGVWTTLQLDVSASSVRVGVDGVAVLEVAEAKRQSRSGPVGLFVDIGTEAFFADLTISADRRTGADGRET